jgi:hypothetical protein
VATEAKPFASLSSGLLARKGAARPAMRPQGFGQVTGGLEDLGWNDMGFEPPKAVDVSRDQDHDAFGEDVVEHPRAHPTGLTPVQSPVHDQQAELVERLTLVEDVVEEDSGVDCQSGVEQAPLVEFTLPDAPDAAVDAPAAIIDAELEQAAVVTAAVPAPAPRRVVAPASVRAPRPRAAAGSKSKAAFTLRLEPDRHLKLRLACAVDGRSAQQLVTDALDQLLERMPELEGLAAKAKRRG